MAEEKEPLPNDETIRLLNNAKNEIRNLREQNNTLRTRLEVYDDMMDLFKGSPYRVGTMDSPDICYGIEQHVQHLGSEDKSG